MVRYARHLWHAIFIDDRRRLHLVRKAWASEYKQRGVVNVVVVTSIDNVIPVGETKEHMLADYQGEN